MSKLKINKYSQKCITNLFITKTIKINLNHSFLELLEKNYLIARDNITNHENNYKIIITKNLCRLHKPDEYALIYIHYLDLQKLAQEQNPNIIKTLEWEEFYNYYLINSTELNKLLDNPNTRIYDIIMNPIKDRKRLHENMYNNNFVTIDIQHICESNNLTYKKIVYKQHKIYLYEIEKKVNINLIIFIIEFMENFAKNDPRPLELVLFMSEQKKLISDFNNGIRDKSLGPFNINSGSSYVGKKIFIWRIEEVYKVLIHELIQFYGIDNKIFHSSQHHNKSSHCIIGEDRINESFTESLAVNIHTYILSKLLNKNFSELMNYEINFSLIQCKKLLNYYGITDITNIIDNNKNISKKSCDATNLINQKTSVFSYFFIKTAFLINIYNLYNFLDKYLENFLDPDIEKFDEFIDSCLNKEYIDLVNSVNLDNIHNTFFANTLRMTCLEFS
jgi:hypothetical protein